MKKLLSLLLLSVLFAAALCRAATLNVSFDYPADQLAYVSEFRVYEQSGTAWAVVGRSTAPSGATAPLLVTLTNVVPGVHTYRATAFNAFWGVESVPSNVVATPPASLAPGLQIRVAVSFTKAELALPPFTLLAKR